MDLKDIPLEQLFLDPNNVRLHDDRNIDAIKGSLKKFGQQKNIVVDKDGIIIAGNGTYTAAKALGWKTLKCNVTTLESYEKMAFALADNRTAELASWDMPKLEEQIKLIEEPELIGFDDDFIKFDDDPTSTPEQDEKEDDVPEVDDNPYGVKRGDIWLLGAYLECDKCGEKTEYDKARVDTPCDCEVA